MCDDCKAAIGKRLIPNTAKETNVDEQRNAMGDLDTKYVYYECSICGTRWTYTEDWGPTGKERSYSYS